MTTFESEDFVWVSNATKCLRDAGFEPDFVRVEETGNILLGFNPDRWGDDDD